MTVKNEGHSESCVIIFCHDGAKAFSVHFPLEMNQLGLVEKHFVAMHFPCFPFNMKDLISSISRHHIARDISISAYLTHASGTLKGLNIGGGSYKYSAF